MDPVVFLIVGPPGSGKSYHRVRWIVDSFLPNRSGALYSNLPLDADTIAEEFEGTETKVEGRLCSIPREVLAEWARFEGGPWDYFADREDGTNPLDKAHVIFDECHVYLPKGAKSPAAWRKRWEDWLGTIRHRGCTVEFITQD